MLGGFYWMYNSGQRKPFQRGLREVLKQKGVPICLACGYDLRGLAEPRCSECGRPFTPDLLNRSLPVPDSPGPE